MPQLFAGVDCGDRGLVGHGTVRVNGTRYPTGVSITLCEPGFFMSGHSLATCDTKGVWSYPLPTCIRKLEDEFVVHRADDYCKKLHDFQYME